MNKKKKILIVDDSLDNLEMMELVLSSEYQLLFADNALNGLELLKQNEVDLVLTDYNMPIRDGLWLLQEVLQKTPLIPVVFVTSTFFVSEKDFRMKGASGVLLKPFTLGELVEAIHLYI